jgi:hypothetical protein
MTRRKDGAKPVRPTKAQIEERIQACVKLLSQGKRKEEIKKAVMRQYDVVARTVEVYLSRARVILLKQSQKSATEHRADSYALYLEIASDTKAARRDRIKARERIDKLLGLELEHGQAIPRDDDLDRAGSTDRVAALRSAVLRLAAQRGIPGPVGGVSGNGNGKGPAPPPAD